VLLFKLATGERLYTFEAALPPNPVFPERSNVSPLTGREFAWPLPMPKASSVSGTRLL